VIGLQGSGETLGFERGLSNGYYNICQPGIMLNLLFKIVAIVFMAAGSAAAVVEPLEMRGQVQILNSRTGVRMMLYKVHGKTPSVGILPRGEPD
jgi:hypothetical protein